MKVSTNVVDVKEKLIMFKSANEEGNFSSTYSSNRKMRGFIQSAFTNQSDAACNTSGQRLTTKISGNRQATRTFVADFINVKNNNCRNKPTMSKVMFSSFSIFGIAFVVMMQILNFARVVESVPAATVENLDSKIRMFLESHCTMQNETLEQAEFKSFMSCGPSHGAGIVKNLGRIPEYKSDDTDQWTKATKREIVSQCEVWPKDRSCQRTTFRLIEKCFEKDQKFIFYFMFALTDVICQSEESDLFIKFWQNGGDTCLGNHIKSLKKDWTECFANTSTVSNDDVLRNIDDVMQCFRTQFDNDCIGENSSEVLNEIMTEIRRVYLETYMGNRRSSASTIMSQAVHLPIIFLTGWMTFWQQHLV